MRKHNFYHFMLRLFALPASLCLVLMQKLAALSQIVYGLGNRKQWALGWTQKGTKYLQIFWEDCHSSQQHSSKCIAIFYGNVEQWETMRRRTMLSFRTSQSLRWSNASTGCITDRYETMRCKASHKGPHVVNVCELRSSKKTQRQPTMSSCFLFCNHHQVNLNPK